MASSTFVVWIFYTPGPTGFSSEHQCWERTETVYGKSCGPQVLQCTSAGASLRRTRGCDGVWRGVPAVQGCDRAYPGEVGDVMERTQGGMDLTQGCEGPSSFSPTVSSRHPWLSWSTFSSLAAYWVPTTVMCDALLPSKPSAQLLLVPISLNCKEKITSRLHWSGPV